MKIQNKLFLILFSFSLLLVAALVLLMQWSIGKGMVEYVNVKEVEALKPLVEELAAEYQKENSWSTLQGNNKKFADLVYLKLKDSGFLQPLPVHRQERPEFRNPPPKFRDSPPDFREPPPDFREPHPGFREPHPEFRGSPPDYREPPPGFREQSAESRRPHREFHRPRSDSEIPQPGNRKPRREFMAPPDSESSSAENRKLPPEFRDPPADGANYALLDSSEGLVAGHYSEDLEYTKTAVTVDQVNVGWLAVQKRNKISDGYELDFIEQQQSYLWIIALTAMILVALVTLPLARHLVGPIKLIITGMHKLTQGKYQQNIELRRQDELGELGRDFNELALTLDENETARKRWLANISHELRTPVAILRGELEAMLDDVRPLSKKNIDSANDEVKHLQYLIDDLHQLTSADIGGMHYRKKSEDLSLWLNSEVHKYSSYLADAGIQLEAAIGEIPAEIFADKTRLCQLFENLINNCIKYAQASLVKISLEVDETSGKSAAIVKVQDNGVGVAEEHLPNLFEHLYRVENSRNRKTGGSGLGLSICAHIVAAHQGEISAEQSSLGGLAIVIELPLSKSAK
ncbi:ATP-binding protein [Psychromonas aquimarina]|uniref:ATP-binding protein n=1 Tax=Psychromonas aquimarina TaxID=444919 RepID=UPI0003F624E8|nr:ATP-binding protein [Psychromonas aquimarina]